LSLKHSSVALATCLAAARIVASANLVPNPGFEQADASGKAGAGWGARAVLTRDARSGRYAARLSSDDRRPVLFQRPFPGVRSGRVSFWYKAARGVAEAEPRAETNLSFQVIPIGETGREYPSQSRVKYQIPASHIGDGQWHRHELTFNYLGRPGVKYVYIGPRISELTSQTMPTGKGEVLYDDLRLAPIGPLARLGPVRIVETPRREGRQGIVVCELVNDGDAALTGIAASLVLPGRSRLRTAGLSSLAPLAKTALRWDIEGERSARQVTIAVEVRADDVEQIRQELVVQPVLELQNLTVPRYVLWQGERQVVSVTLANTGATVATSVNVTAHPPRGVRGRLSRLIDRLPPGATEQLTWEIVGEGSSSLGELTVVAEASNAERTVSTRQLMVSRRMASSGQGITLASRKLRLLWPRNTQGYGLAEIQVRQNHSWRTMGVLPYLARLRFRDSQGATVEHAFAANEAKAKGTAVSFASKWVDAEGAAWRCESEFELRPGERWVECSTSLSVNQPRDILLCEGPLLLAGEGSTGAVKDMALFPGLDFIGRGERSSAVWNPRTVEQDTRVAPHPIKTTIPFMAVSFRDAVVGLMWNGLERWDDIHDCVSARFECPNSGEHYDHNRLSLFVPTVPEWVPENGAEAAKPYRLAPGGRLQFRFQLVARADASALDVQRDRLDRHDVPDVPPKPWDYDEFARRAIDAENEFRYEPEHLTWRHGNRVRGQFNPQVCTVMWLDAMRTIDPKRRTFLRERVLKATDAHRDRMELSLPFHVGMMKPALLGCREMIQGIMDRQLANGGWGLRKKPGLGEWIGKDGTVVSGTCAYEVMRLMRYALVTGAPDVYAAARRGLIALERDPIPRGGQTWEVPVQVADVIVAAFAARAYLDAYRISGDAADLERAVYWAKAGVHFVYLWQHPSQPVMAGCSVPVYGNNWFARPVQWCGREMLEPLLDLAQLNDELPWRRIAECIAVAYMQQTLGPDLRMYPDTASTPSTQLHWPYPYEGWRDFDRYGMLLIDNFWLHSPRRFPCWFMMISPTRVSPLRQGFVESLYRLMGVDPRPHTVVFRGEGGCVHVTAAGRLSEVRMASGNRLTFRSSDVGYALVTGLSRPARVLCDGQELPPVSDLDDVAAGWLRYRGMLVLKLAGSRVAIERVDLDRPLGAYEEIRATANEVRWGPDDLKAWARGRRRGAACNVKATPDVLRLEGDVRSVSLLGPRLRLDATQFRRLTTRVRSDDGRAIIGRVYWSRRDAPRFAQERSAAINVPAGDGARRAQVDLGANAEWRGTVTSLRVDLPPVEIAELGLSR